MRVVQELSEEYIRRSQQLTIMERLEFLEEYRQLLPLSVFEEDRKARLKAWYGTETPPEE